MNARETRFFLLWTDFQDTIKFILNLRINIRKNLFVLGVLLHIEKMPFDLKNAGATFQRAMTFTFHDLKHIVEAYLDDLAAHSHKKVGHSNHLRLFFERCRYYRIRLNPHKFIFCIRSGRLLGFLFSETRIMVDPLKVEAIVQFPPPRNVCKLQGLQGKAKFLHWVIVNYANITKGFMHLLKKGTLLIWDERAQESFDSLKKALVSILC
jgi:hypothetical protein